MSRAPPGAPDAPVEILGAGLAGLSAAITVARAGRHAIVYERRADVGRRFHGDHEGIENYSTRGDALDELRAIGIDPDFTVGTFHQATIYDAKEREYAYRASQPLFYMVRRGPGGDTLDAALKRQALAAGAELRFGQARAELPQGGIVATGPRGAYAIVSGYVFRSSGLPDGVYGAVTDRLAPKGYAYLVVAGGSGTVATCLFSDLRHRQRYLDRTVEFFERRVGLRMDEPEPYGGTGVVRLPRSARRGNVLYAGEAAGFQDALWGFGMRAAMVSGHLAARAVLDGRPERYDRDWKRRFRGLMVTSLVNRWWFERLGDAGYCRFLQRLSAASDARDFLWRRYRPSVIKALWYPLIRRPVAIHPAFIRRV
ncbi:MAG: NAD(P)/FAD-dependent oxidoreductase [Gemmatimonadota bacterium]